MISRVRIYPIETGKPIVVMNEEDAKDLGVFTSGRVEIVFKENIITAIVDTTKTFVKSGEIGIFDDVRRILNIEEGTEFMATVDNGTIVFKKNILS